MKFHLDPQVIDRFPEIEVHAVRVTGLCAAAPKLNDEALLKEAASQLGQEAIELEKLAEYPPIAAWRMAYSKMSIKPSRFRSSIEALIRRVLKGNSVLLPIPAVNFYNALSIMNIAPMGAYNSSKLPNGELVMRLADPANDSFEPLGADTSEFPLTNDLVVYANGNTVLCWGFNCRDNKAVALDIATDDAIFFSESVFKTQSSRSEAVIDALRNRLLALGLNCSEHMLAKAGSSSFTI